MNSRRKPWQQSRQMPNRAPIGRSWSAMDRRADAEYDDEPSVIPDSVIAMREVWPELDPWAPSTSTMTQTEYVQYVQTYDRYYCPKCGTVQVGWCHPEIGWFVPGHRWQTITVHGWEDCPGGEIDPAEDKAP